MPNTVERPTARDYASIIRTLDGEAVENQAFEVIVGGSTSAGIVYNALTVATRQFDDDAAYFRGIATAIACDGEEVRFLTLKGAEGMAVQFAQQAEDTRRVLALLRGDDEEV